MNETIDNQSDRYLSIINSAVGQKTRGLGLKVKELTQLDIDNICVDIAEGISISTIAQKYHISIRRISKIQTFYRQNIEKVASDIEASRDKRILNLANRNREKILSEITSKDIKKANLKSKTASVYDLTQIKRLESGQSTANIGIDLTSMTKEQIENYLKSGNNDVNNNDTTIDVLDTTTEQIDLNTSNHQKEQID